MFSGPTIGYEAFMTSRLRRALALTALFALATPAQADGRTDWPGYAWQQIKISQCAADGHILACPLYRQKWDWKRNQWVDLAITLDIAAGTLELSQRLTDNDSHDDDDVCVTLIALDAAGNNLVAHHQNWHLRHGQVVQKSFTYRSARLAEIASIHIGSKQCRKGPHQDDAIYAAVLAGIRP